MLRRLSFALVSSKQRHSLICRVAGIYKSKVLSRISYDSSALDLADASSFEKADYWVKQILTNEPVISPLSICT